MDLAIAGLGLREPKINMRVIANPDIQHIASRSFMRMHGSAGLLTGVMASFGDARFPLTSSIPLDVTRC